MRISLDNAQRIVSEISSVLGTDVNLMDKRATIIASTDPDRVGTHHAGAERIIVERLDRLIIGPDDQLPGVRPGLNLPVWAEGEITGVLGITGDPRTFTTPAHVLQKMTEILLRETRIRERAERHGRSYARFLQVWLSDSGELTAELIAEGRSFGVDVHERYTVAIARPVSETDPHRSSAGRSASPQAEVDAVTEAVIREAQARGAVTAQLASRIVMLFPASPSASGPAAGTDDRPDVVLARITGWLDEIARNVRRTSALRLAVGISDSGLSAPEAAEQATRALRHALHSAVDVHRFDQLTLEMLLSAIPESAQLAFARRVFDGIPVDNLVETARSLRAYFKADGSLSSAARVLHIHKNTLTGRLNRIAEWTGLDPRRTADASILWLALHVDPEQSRSRGI